MAVYVDKSLYRYGRMVMCHLMADSISELDAMAVKIRIERKYFQMSHSGVPHYDICKTKRALAVKNGALEADRKKVVDLIRFWRREWHGCRTGDCPHETQAECDVELAKI